MRKKWKHKIQKATAIVVCVIATMWNMAGSASAQMTAQQLQQKFPMGTYWNHVVGLAHNIFSLHDMGTCNNPDGYSWHPCTNHWYGQFFSVAVGEYDCNTFGGSIQCRGFANKLAYDTYGSSFFTWNWEYMKKTNIKPGDIIWYYTSPASTVGHQAMIMDVDGTRLCLGECNWYDCCMITWGRWFDLEDVDRWTIYSAPFEIPGGGSENIFIGTKGDVDDNKVRDLADANMILKESLGIANLGDIPKWAADMDGFEGVTLKDAKFSLQVALGVVELPDWKESIWIEELEKYW